MQHALILEEKRHDVALSRAAKGYRLHLDGEELPCSLNRDYDGSYLLTLGDHSERIHAVQHGDDLYVHLDGSSYHLRYHHPLNLLAEQQQGSTDDVLRAPMPGSLIAVEAEIGVVVTRGQTVLVIESMKMETSLKAPRDGVVAEIHVTLGETFDRDAILLSLAPLDTSEPIEEELT